MTTTIGNPAFLSVEIQDRITESHPDRDGAHDYTALPDRHVPQIPVPVEQSMD